MSMLSLNVCCLLGSLRKREVCSLPKVFLFPFNFFYVLDGVYDVSLGFLLSAPANYKAEG